MLAFSRKTLPGVHRLLRVSTIFGDITARNEELRSGTTSESRKREKERKKKRKIAGRRHKNLYGDPRSRDARQAYYVYGRITPMHGNESNEIVPRNGYR